MYASSKVVENMLKAVSSKQPDPTSKGKKKIVQLKTKNQKIKRTYKYYTQTRSNAHVRRLDIQRRQS